MGGVLSAKPTELFNFQSLGIVLFILERIVIALLAFLTAQRNFIPAVSFRGHNKNLRFF